MAFVQCLNAKTETKKYIYVSIIKETMAFPAYRRTRIKYLNPEATKDLFTYDADGYFASLTGADLYARKASSLQEYIERACRATLAFDDNQTELLRSCCTCVDYNLGAPRVQSDPFISSYIDIRALRNIPWILALTRGSEYEEGYPHTRGNVIFLSTRVMNYPIDKLRETLLHEKIHVYQRLYRSQFRGLLGAHGYSVICNKSDVALARANPDTDKYVYSDPNGRNMVAIYNSERPEGINDVTFGPAGEESDTEHPNELIAYAVASRVSELTRPCVFVR